MEGTTRAWQMIMGFLAPMVTKAACELGIPDILAESSTEAGMTCSQIVDKLTLITGAGNSHDVATRELERIMRYLGSIGVFNARLDVKDRATYYSLSPISAVLLANDPTSIRPMLLYQTCEPILAAFHYLPDHVTRGVVPCEAANGGMDIWDLAKSNVKVGAVLNDHMACFSKILLAALFEGYRGFEKLIPPATLVDVGGGTGTTAASIMARYPGSVGKTINFDLPAVIAEAPAYPGVEHVKGNMFDSVPSGDIIFLKWVLHDWDDQDCIRILRNCHKALKQHGKLIIMDSVLGTTNDHRESLQKDIIMMAHTSGRERTKPEWEALLHASGFVQPNFISIPFAEEHVIEAFSNSTS